MSKPEDRPILISGTCLNEPYKGKEFEGTIKIKPPKQPKKIFDLGFDVDLVSLNFVCEFYRR